MAEFFAGGHLRYLNGAWRDDNGDPVDVVKRERGEWVLETHSFYSDTYYESCELSVYITARCKECGCKHPNHYEVFSRTLYAPEDAEEGFRFDKKAEEEKLLAEFKQIKYNLANFCPNCGADMRPEGGADSE